MCGSMSEQQSDPTAHAAVVAASQAVSKLGYINAPVPILLPTTSLPAGVSAGPICLSRSHRAPSSGSRRLRSRFWHRPGESQRNWLRVRSTYFGCAFYGLGSRACRQHWLLGTTRQRAAAAPERPSETHRPQRRPNSRVLTDRRWSRINCSARVGSCARTASTRSRCSASVSCRVPVIGPNTASMRVSRLLRSC